MAPRRLCPSAQPRGAGWPWPGGPPSDARTRDRLRAPRGAQDVPGQRQGPQLEALGIPTPGSTRRRLLRGAASGAGRQGRPRGGSQRDWGFRGASRSSRPVPSPSAASPAGPLRSQSPAPPHAPPPAGDGGLGRASQSSGLAPRPNSPTLQRTKYTPAGQRGAGGRGCVLDRSPPRRGGKAGSGGGAGLRCVRRAVGRCLGQSRGASDLSLRGTGGGCRQGPRPGRGRRPASQLGSRPSPGPAQTRRRGTGCHCVAPRGLKCQPRRGAGSALTASTLAVAAPPPAAPPDPGAAETTTGNRISRGFSDEGPGRVSGISAPPRRRAVPDQVAADPQAGRRRGLTGSAGDCTLTASGSSGTLPLPGGHVPRESF